MKRYEYRIVKTMQDLDFLQLGADGWLFCGPMPPGGDASRAFVWYVFSRELKPSAGRTGKKTA